MADVQATDGEIDRQISSLHKHAFFLKIPVFRRDCNRTEIKHFVCLKNKLLDRGLFGCSTTRQKESNSRKHLCPDKDLAQHQSDSVAFADISHPRTNNGWDALDI
ncbi:hypothetical protein GEV33_004660 [Tenebrio molitor]|uniref:Uncharacterized protein n=1 Tax=Tenebrio molitor TaxID=7067 RepID=A0A8J6HMU3_TENMO|nr:hypothetical protein GEV33_004660 [Tenebrio molitor]